MLSFRPVEKSDLELLFNWANDETTRRNSYSKNPIRYEDHVRWFNNRFNSESFYCYIFSDENGSIIGQVRIEKDESNITATISVSIDKAHRGKGYSTEMLQKASDAFIVNNPGYSIRAFIFKENDASFKSFMKAGYRIIKDAIIENTPTYILEYTKK